MQFVKFMYMLHMLVVSCCVMRISYAKHGASWGQDVTSSVLCVGEMYVDGVTD